MWLGINSGCLSHTCCIAQVSLLGGSSTCHCHVGSSQHKQYSSQKACVHYSIGVGFDYYW
jgi:hypothetical protein